MGFNYKLYNDRQKILLISRLLPMVEPRFNLVEPAPKGTGKSFVFDNMSRYVAVRSGSISPAVLFFNDARKTPGLITRYDCVVIDEAQKVKADNSGELTALLKSYLESGKFGRGSAGSVSAEGGIALLANIDIDENRMPVNDEIGLFRGFPNFLCETAFIDRFQGLLPGWELPRISKDTPSKSYGFKGDIFGEILHTLRSNISFRDYVKTNMELTDCDDMRDNKSIEAGASGLLKILFPHKQPTEGEFYNYCVNPALELRQRVRDELCKIDREYQPITIRSKFPDAFQTHHKLPVYYDIDPDGKRVPLPHLATNDSGLFTPEDPLDLNRKPKDTSLIIKEGAKGYSYKNLFFPYLKDAKEIKLTDAYIRKEHQLKNFIAFCEVLAPKEGNISITLITKSDDNYQKNDIEQKFKDLQSNLLIHGIMFNYQFDENIHDRFIESDNGWRVSLGRGLDIFQKPETNYGLGEFDQQKRKCRETEINFRRVR